VVLLESRGGGRLGERTLLAREPHGVLVGGHDLAIAADAAGTRRLPGAPLEALGAFARESLSARPHGAVVGALAYEAARPARRAEGALLVALAVDRLEPPGPSSPTSGGAELADAAWAAFRAERPPAAAPPAPPDLPRAHAGLEACSSMSRAEHGRLVRRLQEHIARGDIYQANLAQRFRVRAPGTGLALYERLRVVSPTPFGGYLRVGGLEIASASPERLILVDGDRLETRPIAGTRPRGGGGGRGAPPPAARHRDAALRAELLLSEKERAEHLMLVDLARNDLGRVAAIGSVHVDELMVVEEYAHVRHIVSNVRGRLRPGLAPLDALAAVFPGGTITGVPKKRCMEILDAVEPAPRGFYTGALFYLTASGRLDANILIRSAVVEDGIVTWHAGGGIVADSDPAHEYEETLHKAEAVRAALEALSR
jgi:anthranilate/para-aminobenzoate synthase component I